MKIILILFAIIVLPLCCMGQSGSNYVWTRYFNELWLRDTWRLDTELENRVRVSTLSQDQVVGRITFLRKLHNGFMVGQGFSYTGVWQTNMLIPELRPHQEVQYEHDIGRFVLTHRVRMEQRFIRKRENEVLLPTYGFRMRARYEIFVNFNLRKSLEEQGNVTLQMGNETMIHTNKSKKFDQNRFLVGFLFQPFERWALQVNYIYQSSQVNDNIFRVSARHYLRY